MMSLIRPAVILFLLLFIAAGSSYSQAYLEITNKSTGEVYKADIDRTTGIAEFKGINPGRYEQKLFVTKSSGVKLIENGIEVKSFSWEAKRSGDAGAADDTADLYHEEENNGRYNDITFPLLENAENKDYYSISMMRMTVSGHKDVKFDVTARINF